MTSLKGQLTETLTLTRRVEPTANPAQWLSSLLVAMRASLCSSLRACLSTRLDEDASQPLKILEEMNRYMKNASSASSIATGRF